jgi:hypothetical protein
LEANTEVISLIERLKFGSPVRRIAEAIVQGTLRLDENIQPLFAALANPRGRSWREREVAAWALGQIPLDAQERDAAAGMLLDILEGANREPMGQRVGRALVRGIPLIIFCLILDINVNPGPIFTTIFPFLWIVGSLQYQKGCTNLVRARAAETLGRLRVPETVAGLATALFDRNSRVREAAAAALHEVLPTVTPNEYGLFGVNAVASLGRALNHADSLLVFKVLEALEKVGTSHAIPYVEKVAVQGRTIRLRDAAQSTLYMLQQRKQAETESQTLMRAASGPDLMVPRRIRSAEEVSETPPQQQVLQAGESE